MDGFLLLQKIIQWIWEVNLHKNMKTVSIIGFGRFGKTLYRLLHGDFDITIFDVNKSVFDSFRPDKSKSTKIAKNLEDVYKSEVIFYCVPISKFESIIKKHKKYISDNHVLIDTLSVKELPEKIFVDNLFGMKTGVILTHPMFGPDSSKDGFTGLRIVMNNFQGKASSKDYDFWKRYFISQGLKIVELTPKKHDELAARSQGVTHFLGRLLSSYGFSKTPIDTKGAEALYKVMEQTNNDSWELFNNLQNFNQYSRRMRIKMGEAYDCLYNKILPTKANNKYKIFGIQGSIGSFNEQAMMKYIKTNNIIDFKINYLYTSEKVLKNLNSGNIDYGLFAVHNSLGGIVKESLGAMAKYKFKIIEDIVLPIRHFLMKRKEVKSNELNKIMAHPQVFKQCEKTLAKKFPKLILESGEGNMVDTARAAQALSQGKIAVTTAILGPKQLAELYNLQIIAKDLQDKKVNNTTFILVTRINGK